MIILGDAGINYYGGWRISTKSSGLAMLPNHAVLYPQKP